MPLIGRPFLFAERIFQWALAYSICSVVQNVLLSTLIIVKIWRVARPAGSIRIFAPALVVVAESGSAYTILWIMGLVLFSIKSPAFIFILFNLPYISVRFPAREVVFLVVIIRTQQGIITSVIILRAKSIRRAVNRDRTLSTILFEKTTAPRTSDAEKSSKRSEVLNISATTV